MAKRRKHEASEPEPQKDEGEVLQAVAGAPGHLSEIGIGPETIGLAAANPADQLADEQAMLGRMTPLERAMLAFDLEPEHVLGSSVKEGEGGAVEVVLVTQGGQKLRWPADAGRVLAQHEKDGTVPGAPPAGIFPVRK